MMKCVLCPAARPILPLRRDGMLKADRRHGVINVLAVELAGGFEVSKIDQDAPMKRRLVASWTGGTWEVAGKAADRNPLRHTTNRPHGQYLHGGASVSDVKRSREL